MIVVEADEKKADAGCGTTSWEHRAVMEWRGDVFVGSHGKMVTCQLPIEDFARGH